MTRVGPQRHSKKKKNSNQILENSYFLSLWIFFYIFTSVKAEVFYRYRQCCVSLYVKVTAVSITSNRSAKHICKFCFMNTLVTLSDSEHVCKSKPTSGCYPYF